MPKQFLDLFSARTMLQETCDRVGPLTPYERIFVATGEDYAPVVREQLPEIPPDHVIGEPSGKGTAPAIGLGALRMMRLDPEAIMISLHADHAILRVEEFLRALAAAARVAEDGHLVTLGIQPDRPETGYGYIERGHELGVAGGFTAYVADRFTEKPDPEAAERFVRSGRFYWNSGIFVWKASRILREIEQWLPDLAGKLSEIEAAAGTPREAEVLARVWPSIGSETIDEGVLERSERVAVIPIDIGWNDVGSWATLLELLPSDERGNVVMGRHQGLDTHRTLVYSPNRLVVTLGVEDLVIVDAEDVLLICPKERAQDVRAIVEALRGQGKPEYL